MKTKYYTKLLAPLCVFGIIFRTLEIIFAIEPSSGFYYSESVIPLLFNIFIFLVIFFFLSSIVLVKSETKTVRKRLSGLSIFDIIIVILTAVFILASSLKDFLVKWNNSYSYMRAEEIFKDFPVYILIFAALSVIFFVLFTINTKKNYKNAAAALLSVSVPIYYVLRLFKQFMNINDIMSKAYGAYIIIFMGFLALALMNLSKLFAGTLCRKMFVAFGLCSSFLASVHMVEFVLAFFPGNPYNISIDILTYIADFLCALMILRLIVIISQKSQKSQISEKSETETEEENQIV